MKHAKKIYFILIVAALFFILTANFSLAQTTAVKACNGPQCWRILEIPQAWRYQLSWLAVFGAAAIDSINPCEFAILILLMATFLVEGKKKEALQSGMAFTLAIFLTYFAMGLGIFKLINGIKYIQIIKTIVGYAALIIGLLNIKDYFSYGGGGFIMEVPRKWRPRMKDIVRRITGPIGAFFAGIIVSIFLLPCTSGPYFVIIGLLSAEHLTYLKILEYLLFYNIVFIVPMLTIILAMYFGLGHEKAEAWRQNKLRQLHLIAGLMMLAIGALILLGII